MLPGLDLVDASGDARHRPGRPRHHGLRRSSPAAATTTPAWSGIAPKAKILPVRVLDEDNRYDDALIVAKGVRWAVDHGARVINLSLGGSGSSAALAAALDYAFAKDVVVVACTGNASASASTEVWYPAREPGVIAVAGLERQRRRAVVRFDHRQGDGRHRPGRPQLVGARPGGYWRVQGTSFAAPMVSGTAALIRSRWPDDAGRRGGQPDHQDRQGPGPAGPRRPVRLRHGRPDRGADRRRAGGRRQPAGQPPPGTPASGVRRRPSATAPATAAGQAAPGNAGDGWAARRQPPGPMLPAAGARRRPAVGLAIAAAAAPTSAEQCATARTGLRSPRTGRCVS